ncbi:unnamed protein product [Ectocarpus sp. 8 AP-2014]
MCTDVRVGRRKRWVSYIHTCGLCFTLLVSFLSPPPKRIRCWCVACSGWQTSRNSGSVRTKPPLECSRRSKKRDKSACDHGTLLERAALLSRQESKAKAPQQEGCGYGRGGPSCVSTGWICCEC